MASLNDWRVIKRLGVLSLNGRSSHMNFAFSIPIVTWNVTQTQQSSTIDKHLKVITVRMKLMLRWMIFGSANNVELKSSSSH